MPVIGEEHAVISAYGGIEKAFETSEPLSGRAILIRKRYLHGEAEPTVSRQCDGIAISYG